MSRNTPDPILPEHWCEECHCRTAFLFKWDGKRRCRECLRDKLLRAPRGVKRQRLLRLIDGPDFAQGELNFNG